MPRAKIDAAVARHRKDAVENSVEKTRIGGMDPSENVAPHILAVDMPDAVSVTPRERNWIGTGKGQMPRVEDQADAVIGRLHQAVYLGRALDHRANVVMVDELDAPPR